MNILKTLSASLLLIGSVTTANASYIDITGDANISGFYPGISIDGDVLPDTYKLSITDLVGTMTIDANPITSATAGINGVSAALDPILTGILNDVLGIAVPGVYNFGNGGSGFGSTLYSQSYTDPSIDVNGTTYTPFDSVLLEVLNDTLTFTFDEKFDSDYAAQGGFIIAGSLFVLDKSTDSPNNSSLTGTFSLKASSVPEPSVLLLIASGLFGLVGFSRKNKVALFA